MHANKFKGKKVAILGFGIEGRDALRYVDNKGAKITILDRKNEKDLDFRGFNKANYIIISGGDYLKEGLGKYDIVIRSPGVYRYLPEIVDAEKKGVEITSAIKLFFEKCPAKIIGVTGTKGKGTTVSLIYEILKSEKLDTYLAGNIGIPVLDLLSKMTNASWVILELSSFQLIDLDKSPHISVILNITADHLDWHKDKNEYIGAKKNIVTHQKKSDYKVINVDYPISKSFSKLAPSRTYYFSKSDQVNGVYVKDGIIYSWLNRKKVKFGITQNLLLRGEHNWENVCAAICASQLVGVSIDNIKRTIFSFKGLEHRLEYLGKVKGLDFYNDSFSTNPQTTIAAVNSFSQPTTLILGGYDKKLNYDKMARVISNKDNIKNIILIGDIANKIATSLRKVNYQGDVTQMGKSTMKDIVKICIQKTPVNGAVLLSPASSSFDMFKDYKERGKLFKKAVRFYG